MTADPQAPVPPRRIAVNGRPIRLRWLQQAIWLFLAANVGAWIISALYYLVVQVRWHVGGHTFLYLKPDWDNLFGFRGWKADRHDVRNVYEALLATLFVRSLLANWRKRDRRAPAWYVAISPILIVVVAFPIVAAGIWLINYGLPALWHAVLAHHALRNPVHLPESLAWLGTYLSGFPWQPLVIGILAAWSCTACTRRPATPSSCTSSAARWTRPGTRAPPTRRIQIGTCPAGPGRR